MSTVNVEELQRYNSLLIKENTALKEQIMELKRAIKAALAYWPLELPEAIDFSDVVDEEAQHWSERAEHFDQVRKCALDVAVQLIKKQSSPVHYDEISRAFASRYPTLFRSMKNPTDTLSRRLRELRELGYLISPAQGQFFIGPKLASSPRKTVDQT